MLVEAQGEVVGRASANLMPFILKELQGADLDLGKIAEWRQAESERITQERRADLWAAYALKNGLNLDPKN